MNEKCFIVELENIRHNIRVIRGKVGKARIYGVLKGDAYGLGLLPVARILREEGVDAFALTSVSDIEELRSNGFATEELLLLNSTCDPGLISRLIDADATLTIGTPESAWAADSIAAEKNARPGAHIQIDTGMGRTGFFPEEPSKIISIYRQMKSLSITGMYTHFYKAFSDESSVRAQLDAFKSVVAAVAEAGFDPGILHAANSPALFSFPYTMLDAVRVGSALTGRLASKAVSGLKPVGRIRCRIEEIRWLPKGKNIGYGDDFQAKKTLRAALLPLGYADGLCVEKARDSYTISKVAEYTLVNLKKAVTSGGPTAEINNRTARILGHISMENTVLDVTDIECEAGDMAYFNANPIFAGRLLPKLYV